MAKSTELALARNTDLIPQADWDFDRYVDVGRQVEQYRAVTASQAAWILGDLALGVETSYGAQELQRYAEAIGVEYATLMAYRTVARAYESSNRIEDVPWTVHQVLASQPERAGLVRRPEGWTVAAARQFVKDGTAERRNQEVTSRPAAGEAAPRADHDGQAQPATTRPPAAQPVTQPAPAAEAAGTVVPGQVVTEAGVPAEALRRLALAAGMRTDRAEAELAALTAAELIEEITFELEPARASPGSAEPEVPTVGPGDVEAALRVLMSAAGMDRAQQDRWGEHVARHGGSLASAAGVLQAIHDAMTRQSLSLPGPEPARLLRSAVALAESASSPKALLDALGSMPAAELATAAEAVTRLGDRLTQASWLAEDAENRASTAAR